MKSKKVMIDAAENVEGMKVRKQSRITEETLETMERRKGCRNVQNYFFTILL